MPRSSAENPEAFVRRMFDRLNADGIGVAAAEFFAPQIEYHDNPTWPGGGAHHGRAAVVARFEEVFDVLGIQDVVVERVIDAVVVTAARRPKNSVSANIPASSAQPRCSANSSAAPKSGARKPAMNQALYANAGGWKPNAPG